MVYLAEFAGRSIRYRLRYPETPRNFRSWAHAVEGEDYDVSASDEQIETCRQMLKRNVSDGHAEFDALLDPTSRFLLRSDCCLFHSVAFLWRGRAWLLTAPSGTGKSTQFLNWRRQFPGEIIMICGDMPVLERREDSSVWVHPTCWTGKENIGSFRSAPLGGVVLLRQGKENRIETLPVREAISALIPQFVVDPETEDEILRLCALMDAVLSAYPVWRFTNLGDAASTELLRKTLMQESGGDNGTI